MAKTTVGAVVAMAAILIAPQARSQSAPPPSPPAPEQAPGAQLPVPQGGAAAGAAPLQALPPPAVPATAGPAPAGANASVPPPRQASDVLPGASASGQSGAETPPIALPTREATEEGPRSWFARPPLTLSIGEAANPWKITFYGFVEVDAIDDSTRSYADSIGNALVARDDTYEGKVGRMQFSIRNTRLGFELESPTFAGIKPSAIIETDFFGNQPSNSSEAAFFDSPTLRIRHAYFKLTNDIVDVWAGQTYDLFGWQNYFFPCSLEFLGLPNELFDRREQVRLAHTFRTDEMNVDVAVAALRPAQRDSEVPDVNAGIRLSANHWKGITTPGNGGTTALPLSVGVSGVARQFKVNAFTMAPTQSSNSATGWGVSIDALLPIIPAKNAYDRSNRLTLTGSFVVGTGISDLIDANGGAVFPVLYNPAGLNPAPSYPSDIDQGIVTFDQTGVLRTIDWQTFMVGIQYYVPPTGRVILSGNFTQAYSKNIQSLYPPESETIGLLTRVVRLSRYADANVFWDITPAVRAGASFQYTATEYVDNDFPRNLRYMVQGLYFF